MRHEKRKKGKPHEMKLYLGGGSVVGRRSVHPEGGGRVSSSFDKAWAMRLREERQI